MTTMPKVRKATAIIATVTALGPLVAPPIGGAVGVLTDWRGVLIVLAAISAAMFLLAVLVAGASGLVVLGGLKTQSLPSKAAALAIATIFTCYLTSSVLLRHTKL